jgi:hypothetical protein
VLSADTPGSQHSSFLMASPPSHAELHPPIDAHSDEDNDWEDDEQSLLAVGRQPSYGYNVAGGRAGSSSSSSSFSLGRALAGLRLQQLWGQGGGLGPADGKESDGGAAAAAGGVQVLPDAGMALEHGAAEAAARQRR